MCSVYDPGSIGILFKPYNSAVFELIIMNKFCTKASPRNPVGTFIKTGDKDSILCFDHTSGNCLSSLPILPE